MSCHTLHIAGSMPITVVTTLNWNRMWTVLGRHFMVSTSTKNLRYPDSRTTQSMLTLMAPAAAAMMSPLVT